jgi:hypothetical protein
MHSRNIRVAATALGLLLVFGAPRDAAADTALGESNWSLEIGTDLSAGSDDASIAIRRHMGAGSAWRFGIGVSADKRSGDGVRTETGQPDEAGERFDDYSSYSFTVQWMRFGSIRDNLTAVFAIGPVFERSNSSYSENYDIGTPGYSGYEYGDSRTEFGVDLGLGMEWFFTRRLSLGGQASLRATTGTTDVVQISRSGTGGTYDKTEIQFELDTTEVDASAGRIKLTAYF